MTPKEMKTNPVENTSDYDCGLINSYGGGNVNWWHSYIRSELQHCNNFWRSQAEELVFVEQQKIQKLYKALERLEWSNFDPDQKDCYCPACGNSHDMGHKLNCIISIALTETSDET